MLNQPTLQKLETLRLYGMAEAFRTQADPAHRDGLAALSFEERFALLVDQEWTWRQNRALARRLTQANSAIAPRSRTSTSAPRAAWIGPSSVL